VDGGGIAARGARKVIALRMIVVPQSCVVRVVASNVATIHEVSISGVFARRRANRVSQHDGAWECDHAQCVGAHGVAPCGNRSAGEELQRNA